MTVNNMDRVFRIMMFVTYILITSCKQNSVDPPILGVWAMRKDSSVEFTITRDTIEYFDTGYKYAYTLKDKNRLIVTDSGKTILKFRLLSVNKDSLILKSENEGNAGIVYKYYKRD